MATVGLRSLSNLSGLAAGWEMQDGCKETEALFQVWDEQDAVDGQTNVGKSSPGAFNLELFVKSFMYYLVTK